MENCGFRTHLMVIYLSFDRALNNKSVHCQYVQDMCPVYFADCPFCCVWFLVSEGGLVYSVRCSLSWVTGQFLSHNPHSPSQSSFSLSILTLWSPGPPCLSSHSDSQLQVYNVKRGTQKTDLIRILSDVLSACEGLSYKN